jgi:hypothetical protein
MDSLETINGPRATTGAEEAVRSSFNMSHPPPVAPTYCEMTTASIDSTAGTYTGCAALQRSKIFMSTTNMRPTCSGRRVPAQPRVSCFTPASHNLQYSQRQHEREMGQFCGTVLELGVSLVLVLVRGEFVRFLSLCVCVCARIFRPPFFEEPKVHPSTHMLVPRGSHARSCFTLMGEEMEMYSAAPGIAKSRRSTQKHTAAGQR